MTAFKLVVRPDGKAILTANQPLDDATIAAMRAQIATWESFEPAGVLIIPDCTVVHAFELEVGFPEAVPSA
jgi:hypothetical protein